MTKRDFEKLSSLSSLSYNLFRPLLFRTVSISARSLEGLCTLDPSSINLITSSARNIQISAKSIVSGEMTAKHFDLLESFKNLEQVQLTFPVDSFTTSLMLYSKDFEAKFSKFLYHLSHSMVHLHIEKLSNPILLQTVIRSFQTSHTLKRLSIDSILILDNSDLAEEYISLFNHVEATNLSYGCDLITNSCMTKRPAFLDSASKFLVSFEFSMISSYDFKQLARTLSPCPILRRLDISVSESVQTIGSSKMKRAVYVELEDLIQVINQCPNLIDLSLSSFRMDTSMNSAMCMKRRIKKLTINNLSFMGESLWLFSNFIQADRVDLIGLQALPLKDDNIEHPSPEWNTIQIFASYNSFDYIQSFLVWLVGDCQYLTLKNVDVAFCMESFVQTVNLLSKIKRIRISNGGFKSFNWLDLESKSKIVFVE